jgi:hypothetical protein
VGAKTAPQVLSKCLLTAQTWWEVWHDWINPKGLARFAPVTASHITPFANISVQIIGEYRVEAQKQDD